jgi:hypothetical protein
LALAASKLVKGRWNVQPSKRPDVLCHLCRSWFTQSRFNPAIKIGSPVPDKFFARPEVARPFAA